MRESPSSKPRFQWIKYLLCLPCSLPSALLIASLPEKTSELPPPHFLRCVLSEQMLTHSVEGAQESAKEEDFASSDIIPFAQINIHTPATTRNASVASPYAHLANPNSTNTTPKNIEKSALGGAGAISLAPSPLLKPTSAPLLTETASPLSVEHRSVDASFSQLVKLLQPTEPPSSATALLEPLPQASLPIELPPKTVAKNTKTASYPLYEQDAKAFFANSKLVAQEPSETSPAEAPQGHLINFRNAPMGDYIRFVAGLTGRNFVYREEDVDFNVTVVSKEPTSIENVITALLQEFRIHGLALWQQDNNFIIYPALGPLSPAVLLPTEGHPPEIGTRIFQIRHVNADSISEIVTRMLSDQAIVQVVRESNSLLITDFSTNIERIAKIIQNIDSVSVVHDMGQYVATNHSIETLIPLAESILEPLSGGNPPTFVIQATTNSAFIIASTELITQAFAVLDRLDGKSGTTGIFNHADLLRLGEERHRTESATIPASTVPAPAGAEGSKPAAPTPEGGATPSPSGTLGGGIQGQGAEGQARQVRVPEHTLENEGDVLTNTPEGGTVARGTQWTPPPEIRDQGRIGGPAAPPRQRTKFYIYKLDFRKGDQLVAALLSIAESLSYDEEQNRALLDAINSVQWIEASNSIIITGTYEAIIKVKDLIQELDIPLKQVYLEMLILDTSLSDSITFSVDTLDRVSTPGFGAAQGFFGSSNQTQQPLTTVNPNPTISAILDPSPLASVQGFNMGIIGRHIFHNSSAFSSIAALVRALHSNTKIEVVLNPKIVVEDNFPASIFVGQNTAFQTQSIANNNGNILTNNVEYRDVGTSLKVTPQIGNGNIITLTIDQEVSAVVSTTGGGGAGGAQAVSIPVAQTTNKATTVTKVHVPDGYFVVLSGMLRDEKQRARSQMPCIGGIPFLGALFSNVDNRIAKRNYLIFIRPKIVEGESYVEETRRNQDIWDVKNQEPPKWKYEADNALEFLNLPRFNEPNDYRCNPFGSMAPCQSCGAGTGECGSCIDQNGCLDCGCGFPCGCD